MKMLFSQWWRTPEKHFAVKITHNKMNSGEKKEKIITFIWASFYSKDSFVNIGPMTLGGEFLSLLYFFLGLNKFFHYPWIRIIFLTVIRYLRKLKPLKYFIFLSNVYYWKMEKKKKRKKKTKNFDILRDKTRVNTHEK